MSFIEQYTSDLMFLIQLTYFLYVFHKSGDSWNSSASFDCRHVHFIHRIIFSNSLWHTFALYKALFTHVLSQTDNWMSSHTLLLKTSTRPAASAFPLSFLLKKIILNLATFACWHFHISPSILTSKCGTSSLKNDSYLVCSFAKWYHHIHAPTYCWWELALPPLCFILYDKNDTGTYFHLCLVWLWIWH